MPDVWSCDVPRQKPVTHIPTLDLRKQDGEASLKEKLALLDTGAGDASSSCSYRFGDDERLARLQERISIRLAQRSSVLISSNL